MVTKQEKVKVDKFFRNVIDNPITGRITMIGSALRFQDNVMDLILDYEKRGIEQVPISVLSDFIMQSTVSAINEDIIDNADGVINLFNTLENYKREENNEYEKK